MKKPLHKIALFIMISFSHFATSQNLVPNPSFEDTIACPYPTPPGLGGDVKNWFSFGHTPDYFNACVPNVPNGNNSVPTNGWGYQYAASESAYCGFWAYQTFQPNTRELIGGQLLSPLVIGKKYYVSMKISLAEISNCAINKVGILFSNVSYSQYSGLNNPVFPNNFSHFYFSSIVADTLGWTSISDTITADSAYKYIIIGNLFDDINTDTLILGPPKAFEYGAYYFIDDVSVLFDTTNDIAEYNFQDEMRIYPIPSKNKLNIEIFNYFPEKTSIYNYLGMKIYEDLNRNRKKMIDITMFENGLYFIQLIINNRTITQKFIVNH